MDDYLAHSCSDGSHVHVAHSDVAFHEKHNIVKYLRKPDSRREKTVVQIEVLEMRDDSWAGKPSARRTAGEAMNGGLSFRVGEYLAQRVRQKQPWAIVMLAHINNKPARDDIAESEAALDRVLDRLEQQVLAAI